ncbi:MAG: hypothetical protein O6943_13705 [Bacteroidetes bacterium]|nr:hypothetical protein [Bacteroidota bacterium]
MPIFSWINWSFYFLLFLQSLYLYRGAENNKFCFLNIGVFALLNSLSFVPIFAAEQDFLGLAWYLYEYLTIALNFSFTLCIVYICVKYLFRKFNPLTIYAISLSIILPILIWHFYPVFLDKNYIIDHEALFDKNLLYFNFLPLFFLIFYGILLYKYDKSLGEHINAIMVCFFIMTITDIPNLLGYVYHIMIFQLTQYMLLITLSFFLITMFKLLNHTYSAFGQFYDSIIVESKNLGVPIKRKKGLGVLILDFTRAYFHQRRNTITFGTFFFIFFINYFDVPIFVKLTIAVLSFGVLILFFYLTVLYEKRLKEGNLIN